MQSMLYAYMACLLKLIARVEMNLVLAIIIVIFELTLIIIIPIHDKIERLIVF